jgi:hypothetical protein
MVSQIEFNSEPSGDEICLPPSAVDLLESMRAIGYSFESSLADIIDNSISASASSIDITFSPFETPFVAIADNGRGMTSSELTLAMRHGSCDPNLTRNAGDLGRFGLGLKTASLSQCRVLTCISYKDGQLSGRRWDLDHVARRQDWMLLKLSQAEMRLLPMVSELLLKSSGTVVIWQVFDRLAAGELSIERALGSNVDIAREHLNLVFHRFLSGHLGIPSVAISINQNALTPIDPFLSSLKATQILPAQDFKIYGETVSVLPYILPHMSKLKAQELQLAGGEEGLRRNQGFYVYRNGRLISWGSWFRLVKQEELTKLARVRVDITNRLDHLWKLDIKKSAAHPPEALRDGLRQIINRITDGSRKVYTYRGRRSVGDKIIRAWVRTQVREGNSYQINRDHPLLVALSLDIPPNQSELLERLLFLLESTLPFDSIYADMASDIHPSFPENGQNDNSDLLELARKILHSLGPETEAGRQFLLGLPSIEPFAAEQEKAIEIARSLKNAR